MDRLFLSFFTNDKSASSSYLSFSEFCHTIKIKQQQHVRIVRIGSRSTGFGTCPSWITSSSPCDEACWCTRQHRCHEITTIGEYSHVSSFTTSPIVDHGCCDWDNNNHYRHATIVRVTSTYKWESPFTFSPQHTQLQIRYIIILIISSWQNGFLAIMMRAISPTQVVTRTCDRQY